MKKMKMLEVVWIGIGVIMLIVGFPLTGAAEQTGSVVYATNYSMFFHKGGDAASHAAGEGPLIATTVFEGLIDTAVDLSDLPGLAKSWTIAPDWSHIDFDLEEGVKFHNGEIVTAEDVKFSLETAMRPELRNVLGHSYRQRIDNIQVLSRYKVRFNLKMPSPGLFKRLWWCGAIFPKKYREQVGDDGFADKPIGSGPFKWVDYKQDQYFSMEAVKKHHRKTPEFKTLKIVYVPEHSTRLAMLKAGETDIIVLSGPHIPQIKADPALRLVQTKHIIGQTLAYADFPFPEEKSPFQDIRVREAASLAIDRESICEKILFGATEPYGEVICPYTLGWDPTVKPDPYDPERAKALLAEAGYPNGFKTSIGCTAGSKYWIEAIAANLSDVGIQAEVKIYEGGAWWDAYRGKKLRGLITRNSWYDAERNPGADLQDAYTLEAPWAYVTTKEISDAIKQAMRARDDKEAAEWGRKISKMIREKRINMHLWSIHANYGVNEKILKWDRQLGSYPATRFEYMKIKH
jgi:peptide/nickel transport system substrate-binding protein